VVAVRRFEHEHYAHLNREQLADKVPDGLEAYERCRPLAEHIAGVPLIDQHAHGCWLAAGGSVAGLRNALNEANNRAARRLRLGIRHTTGASPCVLTALRLLGLPSTHAEPEDYWGTPQSATPKRGLAQIFLRAGRAVSDWLIDTGYADGVAEGGHRSPRCPANRAPS